jgi:methionine synthase II (cobalamin-independent)
MSFGFHRVRRKRLEARGYARLRGKDKKISPAEQTTRSKISSRTVMTMQTPPFRADHVGSLLRSDAVQAARKQYYQEKSIPAEALKAAEDEAILASIRMQEEVGLKAVTDGECRRSFWHYDFMGMLTGFELEEREEGVQFAGMKEVRPRVRRRDCRRPGRTVRDWAAKIASADRSCRRLPG